MPDPKDRRIELILQSMEQLPTLPTVALRVMELTSSTKTQTSEVVQLIESDPALAARILSIVNHADQGVRTIANVERAVVMLGFDTVRNAVLAVSILEVFQAPSTVPTQFSRDELWKHCVSVACCAELLAAAGSKTHGHVEPSMAFVCGLLHDMGKLALDAMLPKSFARVVEAAELLRGNIADLERSVIGLDHMVVGKRLAERWELPANLRDCMWLHGQHPSALPATVCNARLVNLITLADLLVRQQHLGYSGNFLYPIPEQLLFDAVGLTAEQVAEAMTHLVDRIEPRCAALGLGQSSSGELYRQALTQANKELGRVSTQLAARNKKLALRAKFFDALSGFQSEMRPDAPPVSVLEAIGQTAVAALDVKSAAIFSLSPGRDYAELVMVNDAGEVVDKTIVDAVADALASHCADGPVLSAGKELEWLLTSVSPRLAETDRFWICLTAEGRCIGGVVWGAMAGESQRLSNQLQELTALASGWALALRNSQIREEARALSEQLAESNRRLADLQGELSRSKALMSVGEMAAGAAHEMNNPLAVISGRSQLLASQLHDPKTKAAAQLIFEQSHILSQIITELMDFARPSRPQLQKWSVSELISESLQEAKAANESVDRTVEVVVGDVPVVIVDRSQISAALQEVISNALQATQNKIRGNVSIHAGFDPYSKRVVMTVVDEGCGMDEATARRAFDPFFSAQPAGRRRGMGLAKALRWVEGSGGSIRLESRPGKGTRVVILLPASAEPASVSQNVTSSVTTETRKQA